MAALPDTEAVVCRREDVELRLDSGALQGRQLIIIRDK
jgi:hypothetical protein